jgi:FtsZ-binding cell division protein ZapB
MKHLDKNNLVFSHAQRINTITVLELEVEVLKLKLKHHATVQKIYTLNNIHTAISVLTSRIDELKEEGLKEKYGRAVETINAGLEELG